MIVDRKFQLTDLVGNNNKFWHVQYNGTSMTTTFGRVGTKGQTSTKIVSLSEVMSTIASKIKKGYTEIVQATQKVVVGTGATYDSTIEKVVNDIMRSANLTLAKTLNTTVDALALSQINMAREVLKLMAPKKSMSLVNQYFNLIPTKLGHKIKPQEVVEKFNIADEYDRLNQLEVQLNSIQTQVKTGKTQFDELCERMSVVPVNSQEWNDIIKYVNSGCVHGYKVRVKHIFAVTIPDERARFEANTFGATETMRLWHGGRTANAPHILMSGMRIMPTAANGSMFGRGVYLASEVSKSANYCDKSNDGLQYLYLLDAHVGNKFVAPEGHGYTAAPQGFHSVWGKKGITKTWHSSGLQNHEYIVYRESQCTIRYFVAYEKA